MIQKLRAKLIYWMWFQFHVSGFTAMSEECIIWNNVVLLRLPWWSKSLEVSQSTKPRQRTIVMQKKNRFWLSTTRYNRMNEWMNEWKCLFLCALKKLEISLVYRTEIKSSLQELIIEMRNPNVTWRIILPVYLFTTELRHTCSSLLFLSK